MRRTLSAVFAVLILASCSAAPDAITGFSDCAAWTGEDWGRADSEARHDAALAFLVECSGSTDETFSRLAAAPEDQRLAGQCELMQDTITAWFAQVETGSTLSDLLELTQQAAGKD